MNMIDISGSTVSSNDIYVNPIYLEKDNYLA